MFRDIPTPEGTVGLLNPAQSVQVGLYDTGAKGEHERLVGAVVYRTANDGASKTGELLAVTTKPSHRRREIGSLLVASMLEHMRAEGCEVCWAVLSFFRCAPLCNTIHRCAIV